MSTPDHARPFTVSLFLLVMLLLTACTSAQASPPAPSPTTAAPDGPPVAVAVPILAPEAARPERAAQPPPTVSAPLLPTSTSTTIPPSATPDPAASPTPRPVGVAPRVGLQVGHLRSHELPEELARLRTSTGARWGEVTEAQLNLEIVTRVKALLEAQGVVVDLLPATVPPAYDADAFLSIHADGSTSPAARGWKLATPWRASEASKQLLERVAAAYGPATGMPEDVGGITFNMKGYYAFNWRRHTHAISRYTPAIIVETGFMTSAADRAVLFNQQDRVARGIADGVLAYLRQRDPNNGAALVPPDYPVFRALQAGVAVRAAPREDARLLARVDPTVRISPFDRRDGWYQAFVRVGESRVVGWIREDQIVATNEQAVFPTPTNP